MRRKEVILIGSIVILLLGVISWLEDRKTSGSYVEITLQGERYGVYALEENQAITIDKGNCLIIEDETVYMEWATCANQLCVYQGEIRNRGEAIVCLPHKVVVEVIEDIEK
ncbi:MAG: NusG domain II-containing protein [Eubacteriales bacterium]